MADVTSSFKTAGIVPDIINASPEAYLSVTYNDKKLEFSQVLTPTLVKDVPVVTWDAEPNTYYTLAMIDPDAPSRQDPKFREVLHWLATNVPGNDLAKGDHLAEYVGSGPPKDTGLHRYIFLLYKQPSKLTFEWENRISSKSRKGRLSFSFQKFVDKYGLGAPIEGNMFQAEYDDYVPIRNQQITD